MAIGNNLRVLMAERKIDSISELHRKTHLKKFHYATIYNFAKGLHRRLDSDLVEAICKDLDCDIKDLLYIEKKQETQEKEVI